MSADAKPIHRLRDALEMRRLEEIERLASMGSAGSALPVDSLSSLAHLQLALFAVGEEIAAHDVKLGGGSEKPLE